MTANNRNLNRLFIPFLFLSFLLLNNPSFAGFDKAIENQSNLAGTIASNFLEQPMPSNPINGWLTYELVETNSVAGYNTYRVFLNTDTPGIELSAIFGVVDANGTTPLSITSDGNFYQDPLGGVVSSDVNPLVYPFFPELEYDSWLTIGMEPGAGIIYTLGVSSTDFDEDGLIIDDAIGAVIYFVPGTIPEAVIGPDGKILIGQFTISDTSYLNMNFQMIDNDETFFFEQLQLTFPDPYLGCNNPVACNYDPLATLDENLCILPTCNDITACNYDPSLDCVDNSTCILPDGCTDPLACNFDPTAQCDNGSCLLPDGCTDPLAINYDDQALCDDGSCFYILEGCTDDAACNYVELANQDDGSCTYPAPNFDCDGNCIVFDECGNCGGTEYAGCTDQTACNYDGNAGCDDGSCLYVITNIEGCIDSNAINFMASANTDVGSCIYAGCTDSNADNYASTAAYDDGSCEINGEPITYGCTDDGALNFDPAANYNQGCVFAPPVPGCTDSEAVNYMPAATTDDGSCDYTPPASSCTGDLNNDGLVNTSDLSIFLGNFGSVCP